MVRIHPQWLIFFMVGVAQLAERQIVSLVYAGSNPVYHPNIMWQ